MSYKDVRFCFNCKMKPEELEKLEPPRVLKTCCKCKIAQYCCYSQEKNSQCQKQDYDARHKKICRQSFRPVYKRALKAENYLRSRGQDVTKGLHNDSHEFHSEAAEIRYIFMYI